jgi:hypothetical protein
MENIFIKKSTAVAVVTRKFQFLLCVGLGLLQLIVVVSNEWLRRQREHLE